MLFISLLKVAEKLAENNKLVTFGIVPDKAETGYGYIKANIDNTADYYKIQSFTEKPNEEDAKNI
jgi:mannose-1-phosphate guanylyltransferase (GDP) (EC 2.7.7.22)/mannose-6-phosphate isomerase, type 2 (EC 5.3.1.8)